jgi:hypothetical protein
LNRQLGRVVVQVGHRWNRYPCGFASAQDQVQRANDMYLVAHLMADAWLFRPRIGVSCVGLTDDGVVAETGLDDVDASSAFDAVIAVAADQDVVAGASDQDVAGYPAVEVLGQVERPCSQP